MARNGVVFDVLHEALASDESALIVNFAIFNGIFLNKGWPIEKMLKDVLFSVSQCDFLKNVKTELFCKQNRYENCVTRGENIALNEVLAFLWKLWQKTVSKTQEVFAHITEKCKQTKQTKN